jgi:rubrerythrin
LILISDVCTGPIEGGREVAAKQQKPLKALLSCRQLTKNRKVTITSSQTLAKRLFTPSHFRLSGDYFMAKTDENLKAAFAGESQANRMYLAFAKVAEKEGFPQVAKLFKAAAEAETVHALNHLNVMGSVKTTADNLSTAVTGETYEFTKMYPQMIEDAKTEGNKKALQSFDYANKVEAIHADLYKKAIDAVKGKKDLPKADIYVCPVCGNTFVDGEPDKCPICATPKAKFMKIA